MSKLPTKSPYRPKVDSPLIKKNAQSNSAKFYKKALTNNEFHSLFPFIDLEVSTNLNPKIISKLNRSKLKSKRKSLDYSFGKILNDSDEELNNQPPKKDIKSSTSPDIFSSTQKIQVFKENEKMTADETNSSFKTINSSSSSNFDQASPEKIQIPAEYTDISRATVTPLSESQYSIKDETVIEARETVSQKYDSLYGRDNKISYIEILLKERAFWKNHLRLLAELKQETNKNVKEYENKGCHGQPTYHQKNLIDQLPEFKAFYENNVITKEDIEKVHERAFARVEKIIENKLMSKYGENIKTIKDRDIFLSNIINNANRNLTIHDFNKSYINDENEGKELKLRLQNRNLAGIDANLYCGRIESF